MWLVQNWIWNYSETAAEKSISLYFYMLNQHTPVEMSITTHYLILKDKLRETVIKFWTQCYYKYLASGEYSELYSFFCFGDIT